MPRDGKIEKKREDIRINMTKEDELKVSRHNTHIRWWRKNTVLGMREQRKEKL